MAKNLFNSIKLTKPQSNAFDLTHDVKLSLNMGQLVPIMVTETIPGDKFNIAAESLIRFQPLVAPMMHRVDVSIHYFFVPNRILWDGWEKWIVNDDTFTGEHPYVTLDNTTYTSYPLLDYMGLPQVTSGNQVKVNAFPLAGYQAIYNEYYRDQNLIAPVDYKLSDGDNSASTQFLELRRRAWEHDYFTSCLPWAQKGAAVDIPLGKVELDPAWSASGTPQFKNALGVTQAGDIQQTTLPTGIVVSPFTQKTAYDPDGSLEVQPTTINDLRRAFRLQEWLEKNARGGTRYIENILVHFGVKSPDARLQRPEYITGVKTPVVISEVLNTTGIDGELPQGNMAGHGVGVATGKFGSYYCQEHGFIIGIMSIMPKTAYQQGVHKKWLKIDDPFQYFWPTFAHIGEQEVLNKEVYVDGGDIDGTFGYVPRYAEYKFENNRVAGDFKTSLNYWHMGRIFATDPALNQEFIECDPTTRVFAVEDPSVQKILAHVLNKVTAVRKMPKYGTPTF